MVKKFEYQNLGIAEDVWFAIEKLWRWQRYQKLPAAFIIVLFLTFTVFLFKARDHGGFGAVAFVAFVLGWILSLLYFLSRISWASWALRAKHNKVKGALGQIRMAWPKHIHFPKTRLLRRIVMSFGLCIYVSVTLTLMAVLWRFAPLLSLAISLFAFHYIVKYEDYLPGKRWSSTRADLELRNDPRKPVLFLRSFQDEWLSPSGYTIESALVNVLSGIGPVLAIGKPKDRFPKHGAARFYVPDEGWQDIVTRLLDMCRCAVFFVGESTGVVWEERAALSRLKPHQVLFHFGKHVCPNERERRFQAFRTRHLNTLNVTLPENLGDSCYLTFDSDWRPILLDDATLMSFKAIHYKNFLDEAIQHPEFRQWVWEETGGTPNIDKVANELVTIRFATRILWACRFKIIGLLIIGVTGILAALAIVVLMADTALDSDRWSLNGIAFSVGMSALPAAAGVLALHAIRATQKKIAKVRKLQSILG